MTRNISIAVGEFHTEELSNFSQTRSFENYELTSAIRLEDSKTTASGKELVTGEIVSETVEEVKEMKINKEERKTTKDHILRLDEHDQLELVKNEKNNIVSTETTEKIDTNHTSLSIINNEVGLLEGKEDSISVINQAQEPEVRLVEIEVGELLEELARQNRLKSTKQATFSEVDVETDQVTISGYNPLEKRDLGDKGVLQYVVATLHYRNQELTCGIHRHKGLVLFAPMNYPMREIGDFIVEWILDFVTPFP